MAVFEVGSGADEGDEVGEVTARQRAWADSTSLKTIARAAAGLPAPRVTLVRSFTVEKVDSIGFVVLRWTQ